MLPDYICNLHYECKKESTELTNSSQAGSIDNVASLRELIRRQTGSTTDVIRRFLSENAHRYRPRSGHEEAEEEKEEIPADDTSPVTCLTLLLGCVQWLPNLWLSFNFKLVVLMCCIFPFVFYVQLGLYLTLKQKWIHECRTKIPPGKLHSEAWFSFNFTDIDIKSPFTLIVVILVTLVWLMVAFFLRPMDLFLPKRIVKRYCIICNFIPKLARACTCATENQTDQSTETDRCTTENQTDQSTETDRCTTENQTDQSTETDRCTTENQTDQSTETNRRTTENQTDQSTRTDLRTTENQTDQSTRTDHRTTENQTDQSEETQYLLSDSFQLYQSTESQIVQSTETDRSFSTALSDSCQFYSTEAPVTDLTPILPVSAQTFLDNLFSESVSIGDEAIQHLKLLQEAVYLLMSLFVKQLKGVTSFCSCFLVNKVNLWKLNRSRLSHARFSLCLSLSILFTLILGVVSGAICLVLFFFKLLLCFFFCSPSVTFFLWVVMKVGFVFAFKTRGYRVYCAILGISCASSVFYVSYLQVSTICDFIFGILVFSIMGLVLNIEIVTPYVAFFLVVTTNIYCCYANLQNRYKEVKGFILEYWQQELQTTSSEQSTIPTKLFWFVCNREFPVKTEICLMFRNMVVIVTFLFLAIFSIIFFGNTYDISTLVSTIAVFISGAIPSLFFKGLTRGKNFTGWEKIKLRREIETAVKEYPRGRSLYMHCDQESAESGRVGINRESEEVISISRSGHSLVV